ncbi:MULTISPECIES: GTP cyclohydrolase II [Vibrio]|jgi:GTP cyclohydrolase II|uniref:GTP cyclohydrolase-2 n=2 Tax=Vibrio coralliilyticus TaxID=190893 RepID=A0AAJ3BEZ4_9VIBR|nr:GTP cyclohydrolase [Vibrio coralliilyticus]EEX33538.1 GTP cyclohydrolase II [Vibrio coralliilyticus ATCC BAA-450]KFI10802.1 GTP cyclohydrolase [Vibrio sp. B183]QFT36113.1 GTP cyclohydrolase-2 [Vibrio sp. THAF64]QGM34013.1 GTP cyclohydrolase-2 [Vibrio sp. THAF191d]QGN69515.1 GTP cyclohydrolase-2 [Vibrio sp. THAF191c]QIJ85343.1 GTP cyclohydrolase II [Vibrio coralliilyticus OCN008]
MIEIEDSKIQVSRDMAEVRARVDFKVGKNSDIEAELLSFKGLKTDKEHVAIIFKQADKTQSSPLVRLHSECLTGDVFHSSRCDCGEQLDETINKMGESGGIILYLRQEGRGIGLYNKIDAYKLQSEGLNTYEANNHLGFGDDLRDFTEAAQMLKALDVNKIRLITNNPKKIRELKEHGVEIEDTVNTSAHIKDGNEGYLKAKVSHGKHDLKL